MMLMPSLPYLAKTTTMTPFKLTPRARQRLFFTSAFAAWKDGFPAVAPLRTGAVAAVSAVIPGLGWLDFCSWQAGPERINSRLLDVLAVAGTPVLAFQNAETMGDRSF